MADSLLAALEFERDQDPQDIDNFRSDLIDEWMRVAKELRPAQEAWAQAAPEEIRPVVPRLHGPLHPVLV